MTTRDSILDFIYSIGKVQYPWINEKWYKWVINTVITLLIQDVPFNKDGTTTVETAEVRRFNDRLEKIKKGEI